jgi:phosphohistidine phosphatase
MLLRHAKSDWSRPGLPDRDRTLNARGREAAPMMAVHISNHGLAPQRVIVSSAVRTRETWKLMAPSFARKPETIFEQRLYEASPHTILSVIKETPDSIKSLMIVGHNPGLHTLALALVGSGDGLREDLAAKFPTGARDRQARALHQAAIPARRRGLRVEIPLYRSCTVMA